MAKRPAIERAFLDRTEPHTGDHYWPNRWALRRARSLRLGSLEGITGGGKSRLLAHAVDHGVVDELPVHVARSSVTRDLRECELPQSPKERPYQRYYKLSTAEDREEIWTRLVRQRTYLQADTHPTTKDFYATEIDAYDPRAFNVIELMAAARKRIIQRGIVRNVMQVCLVPCDIQTWQEALHGRNGKLSEEEELQRMVEAQCSLRDSQENPDMRFVVNEYDDQAHFQVLDAWAGRLDPDISDAGRLVATSTLTYIDNFVSVHVPRLATEHS